MSDFRRCIDNRDYNFFVSCSILFMDMECGGLKFPVADIFLYWIRFGLTTEAKPEVEPENKVPVEQPVAT